MYNSIVLLFSLLFAAQISAQSLISIDSISSYVGETVQVCSVVKDTFVTKGDKPVTYLNLGADYPNNKLTIVIFQKDLIHFPTTPSVHYKGLNVCVTGEVGTYKDKVQIIANKAEQIEVK